MQIGDLMSDDEFDEECEPGFTGVCEECRKFGRWWDFKYTNMRSQTTKIGWCSQRCYEIYHDLIYYTKDELNEWENAKWVDEEVQRMVDDSYSDH